MITAQEIMSSELITFTPEMDFVSAARILLEHHINGAPVVDTQGNLKGILCQSDLVAQQKSMPVPTLLTLLDSFVPLGSIKHMEKEARKIAALTVAEAMTPDPVTIRPDTSIDTIAALMVDSGFHTLPVLEGKKLVGVVGKADILRTLLTTSPSH